MTFNKGSLWKITRVVAFLMLVMQLASCSAESAQEFAQAHPILMILYGLALIAALIAIVVGGIALIVTYAGIAAFFVFTFFLPFHFD